MFEVGDLVKLRSEVTKQVLLMWLEKSKCSRLLSPTKVYTVLNIDPNQTEGLISVEESIYVYPAAFFEKVESVVLPVLQPLFFASWQD